MISSSPARPDSARVREATPFPHAFFAALLPDALFAALATALRGDVMWHYHRNCFFEQYEVNCLAPDIAPQLREACARAAETARQAMEAAFGIAFAPVEELAAHRLDAGQFINPHNDDPIDGGPTHRLVLGMGDEPGTRGGELALHGAPDQPPQSSFAPGPNQALAMALSERSFHSVARVSSGQRHTLVFSFRPRQYGDTPRPAPPDRLRLLTNLLETLGARTIAHSGQDLLSHLANTAGLLRKWGCDENIVIAGLFHSVFGTPSFPVALVGRDEAGQLGDIIGGPALELVELFHATPASEYFRAWSKDGDNQRARALVLLHLANCFEQASREPGPLDLSETQLAALAQRQARLPRDTRTWLANFAAPDWRGRFAP